MAKKKKPISEPEEDEVPEGKVDEDGDEIIDLYEEKDNLEEDLIFDLDSIEDDMLADETEDEEFGLDVDETLALLRKVKCNPCAGSSSKRECQVRTDFGCPPDKANK